MTISLSLAYATLTGMSLILGYAIITCILMEVIRVMNE